MENESLVKLETAFLAQEKGFNWNTVFGLDSFNRIRAKLAHNTEGSFISWDKHDHNLRLPTQAVLQKWLREKHNLYVESNPNASGYGWFIDKTCGTYIKSSEFEGPNDGGRWDKYEEALEIGLQEALKLVKNGNK